MVTPGAPAANRRISVGSDFSDYAYHAAEDGGLGGADRLHRLVLGLQTDVVGLAEEALDGRLVADQGDDDLAVAGVVGGPDDDVVASKIPASFMLSPRTRRT